MAQGVPSNCKVTKEEFLEQLMKNNGNCYKTYTEMGVPYSIYLKWKSDPDFVEEIAKTKKKGVEYAEGKLFELIDKGDSKLLKFFLACKGGYSEKKTIELDSRNVIDVQSAIDSIKAELEAD